VSQISLSSICKSYKSGGRPQPVLRDLSLSIPAGSFTILIGKSGSGKSTLLNLIAGLDRPDSGSIRIGETEVTTLNADALADFRLTKVGLVFQFFNFLPTLTIEENVRLPAHLAGRSTSSAARSAGELLETMGIQQLAFKFPHEVSGGELQRAAVARALINNPTLVLADEPTGNLDAVNSANVFDLLISQTRSRGASLIMATHELDFSSAADKVVELKSEANNAR
jgi:putative ABC transport system ATP-binding protein